MSIRPPWFIEIISGKFLIVVFLPLLKWMISPFFSLISNDLSCKNVNDQGISRLGTTISYLKLSSSDLISKGSIKIKIII